MLKRLQWLLVDRLLIDPTIGAALNRHQIPLGLPPVRRVFRDWINQANVVVGMFPEWFAQPQPDWPSNLRLTGFPLAFCSRDMWSRFPLGYLRACPRSSRRRWHHEPGPSGCRTAIDKAMGFDQYDNSDRAMRLGVALELLPKNYQVDNIIACIDRLIYDRNIRIRCSELARRTGYDGVPKTCDHILEALGSYIRPDTFSAR